MKLLWLIKKKNKCFNKIKSSLCYLFVLVKGVLLDFLLQPVGRLPDIVQDHIQHGPTLVLGKCALHRLLLVLLSRHQLYKLLFLLKGRPKNILTYLLLTFASK